MRITRQEVAQKLIDYLQHRITLTELVDWAEVAMMEAEFGDRNAFRPFSSLRPISFPFKLLIAYDSTTRTVTHYSFPGPP